MTEPFNTWLNALGNLFARDEFAAGLLQRSFKQPEAWLELGAVLLLSYAAMFGAARINRSGSLKRSRLLQHMASRLLSPVLMLLLGTIGQIIWTLMGWQIVWLRLFVLIAIWLIVIRAILALLHLALPASPWTDTAERSAFTALWVWFVPWLSGIDEIIIQWLQSIQFSVGASRLNVYTVITGLLWVGVVMVMMMWLAKWLNNRLMNSAHLDINLRIVLSKITKTVLMILSVLIALPLVGIDLTVLSVFGGALGVGLGFGLQKIASNYVSGFIILADRSIRPGDRLTVNNFTGYVTQITSRFVVLQSVAGEEALIPNETFVTSTVINESYTAKALYQKLELQVAYDTDLNLALAIMREAATEQERVADDPAPNALLVSFGENGIVLRIGFWVKDPENGFAGLFSAILMTIWQQFAAANIQFAHPQRQVRVLPPSPQESAEQNNIGSERA